jgi:hypothetical protein
LLRLVPQLKGARVAASADGDRWVEGTLLGVDAIERQTADGVTKEVLLSLVADGEVLAFDLYAARIRLLDEGLRRDLEHFLRVQLAARRKDRRTFAFAARGDGRRTVRLGYVVEAPVWKATYRLLLADEGSSEPPLVQGWAVVDNPTDEDWEGVELALVAGLPVSFMHDLATPRYLRRPEVAVQETAGVLPPVVEEGMVAADAAFAFGHDDGDTTTNFDPTELRSRRVALAAPGAVGGGKAKGFAEVSRLRGSAASSTPVQTRERQVGELFEYAIAEPVTVRRNQSALVPIVLKPFAGRPVLLYQKAARGENPLRCVEFDNTTGLTLEGGPVTVLQGDRYVGEAMLDTTRPGDTRLLAYAVELGVRVTDTLDSHTEPVRRVTVRGGVLTTHAALVRQTTYTFHNKTQREQTVYLDHPRPAPEWLLLEPAAHETTDNHWRFRFVLPPGQVTAFRVRAQWPTQQSFRFENMGDDVPALWLSQTFLDAATAAALGRAVALRREVAALESAAKRLEQERAEIHAEQARIRENLQALGDRPGERDLRERYVRTLGEQEGRLAAIAAELRERQAERDAARTRLSELVAALEYEGTVG